MMLSAPGTPMMKLQQATYLPGVVGGRVSADNRLAAAVEQAIDEADRDAAQVAHREVGAGRKRPGIVRVEILKRVISACS